MLVNFNKKDNLSFTEPQKIIIAGSTGSIGQSALKVVREYPEKFKVTGLSGGVNCELLAQQCKEFKPEVVLIREEKKDVLYHQLKQLSCSVNIVTSSEEGWRSFCQETSYNRALIAVSGFLGLLPLYLCLEKGKTVALANKESIVAGGYLLKKILQEKGCILPVDSEHSALFELLTAYQERKVDEITLTASGGPFWEKGEEELKNVAVEEALAHPRWNMGAKITIDSATLMNKALEIIEAYWLFGFAEDKIKVLIHPESIVHSFITFADGTSTALLGYPDMKQPISRALFYPKEAGKNIVKKLNLAEINKLSFYYLDPHRFKAVKIARKLLKNNLFGDLVLFVLANEIAVDKFLRREIPFLSILLYVEEMLEKFGGEREKDSVFELLQYAERIKIRLSEAISKERSFTIKAQTV